MQVNRIFMYRRTEKRLKGKELREKKIKKRRKPRQRLTRKP